MIPIEITYNGKPFQPVGDGMGTAILYDAKMMVAKKLAPFENEIATSGGSIELRATGANYENEVVLKGMADELIEKLKEALTR